MEIEDQEILSLMDDNMKFNKGIDNSEENDISSSEDDKYDEFKGKFDGIFDRFDDEDWIYIDEDEKKLDVETKEITISREENKQQLYDLLLKRTIKISNISSEFGKIEVSFVVFKKYFLM
jgi:hypothetical protein